MVKSLLLENRVNVNNGACHPSDDHASVIETPLHAAALEEHTAIVELLLDYAGIDVNLGDVPGWSPLHIAIFFYNTSIMELLLVRADIDVNLPDWHGDTPLHRVIKRGDIPMIKLLLDYPGIDVNLQNPYGTTPLHRAATEGDPWILKLLCAHPKIEFDSKDDEGRDVFSLVEEKQEKLSNYKGDESARQSILKLEECLDIIRAAMEERKYGSSAPLVEQNSQT